MTDTVASSSASAEIRENHRDHSHPASASIRASEPQSAACCDPPALIACCEPADKAACCGARLAGAGMALPTVPAACGCEAGIPV